MRKTICLIAAVMLLQACGKIDDVYVYDDEEAVIDWIAVATQSTDALIAQFWNAEGYFNYGSNQSDPGFQYWPNAHAMDVVIDAYQRTGDARYKAYFDAWYNGVRVKNGNTYYNHFYDDMQWSALTILRLYQETDEVKYLNTAKELWVDIAKGWNDEYAGGGIAWTKGQPYSKNACSNGPASLLALRLYAETNDESYRDWALRIYEWQKNTLYEHATGAVYDNINGQTQVINRVALTYNQGLFMATAVDLFRITGERVYLNDAQKIANYTITKCIDASNNILRNEGMGDNALFKGIFMRYFEDLLQVPELNPAYRQKFVSFLHHNAVVLWQQGTYPETLLFGPVWNERIIGSTQLTAQASACMTLTAKAKYETANQN